MSEKPVRRLAADAHERVVVVVRFAWAALAAVAFAVAMVIVSFTGADRPLAAGCAITMGIVVVALVTASVSSWFRYIDARDRLKEALDV